MTVALYLAYYGIVPPEEWMYDINVKINNNSIKEYLSLWNY